MYRAFEFQLRAALRALLELILPEFLPLLLHAQTAEALQKDQRSCLQ